ncbi:MAG: hypothetical protein JOZ62_08085 [Acidobacteriaceae bacterium]|nr:hypothetical protein [Acidobacteriaceae bacterium]
MSVHLNNNKWFNIPGARVTGQSTHLAIIQRTGHKNLETLKKYVRPAQAFRRDLLAGVL